MGPIHLFTFYLFLLSCLTIAHVILDSSSYIHVTPLRLFLSFVIPSFAVIKALAKRNLSKSGAISAWLVGFLLTNFSYVHTFTMLVFFFTSSKLTKLGSERKRRIEADYEKSSQRDWQQVIANGGVAAMFSLLAVIRFGFGLERPVDLKNNYFASWYDLAILGSLASATGDTWSSELGSAFGSAWPRLITTFRKVPAGTNGAISLIGMLGSAAGGFIVGVAYYLCTLYFCPALSFPINFPQYYIIFISSICGLFGSSVDSLLGATLQYSGYDQETKRVVQEPGKHIKRISGRILLNNNSVNLISSLATAFFAPFVAQKVFRPF